MLVTFQPPPHCANLPPSLPAKCVQQPPTSQTSKAYLRFDGGRGTATYLNCKHPLHPCTVNQNHTFILLTTTELRPLMVPEKAHFGNVGILTSESNFFKCFILFQTYKFTDLQCNAKFLSNYMNLFWLNV